MAQKWILLKGLKKHLRSTKLDICLFIYLLCRALQGYNGMCVLNR